MRSIGQDNGRWKNWARLVVLSLMVGAGTCAMPSWGQTPDNERTTLQHLSKAFTAIAESATPGVVFIEIERLGVPFAFNNPFDLFGEEFFERFFGRRFSERRPSRQFRQTGQGSGCIISADGYILTNHHVVGDAERITVSLVDGRKFIAKMIGTDPQSDVAVIKIDGTGLPVLPLGDSDTLKAGEWVMAIGNPFGLTHTVTVGIVSATGRSRLGIADYEDFIQTDASINPGNSGGPLLNITGQVVGINTAIFTRSGGYMGIGFAIPINMARAIQEQLVLTGKVVRGFLGVVIQDVTEDLAESFALPGPGGALLAEVLTASPAARAGLQPGDVIVAFNGTTVQDGEQLRHMVARSTPGTLVTVALIRNGESQNITVTIEELPPEPMTGEPEIAEQAQLGLAVQDLTDELAEQFGYKMNTGVVIAQVEPDSPADRAGLRPSMLIHQANRQPISNVREFQQALAKLDSIKRVLFLVQDEQASRFVVLRLD